MTEGKDIQILIDERELHGGRTEGPLRFEPSDNAAEHCRGHDPHNRWIELNSADQCRDEGHTACRDRDPSGQDEFAATLDLGGELIYFHLQPLNLVPGITFIHDGHAGER